LLLLERKLRVLVEPLVELDERAELGARGLLDVAVDLVAGSGRRHQGARRGRRRGRATGQEQERREISHSFSPRLFALRVRAHRSLAERDRGFESFSSSVAVTASSLIFA